MKRRDLLTLCASPLLAASRARHATASVSQSSSIPLPQGTRLPFKWQAVPVTREGLRLRIPSAPGPLRVTVAVDSREPKKIQVENDRGRALGVFDMRFAHEFEIFELPLEPARSLQLRLIEGASPAWIFSAKAPAPLLPHLLKPGSLRPIDEFHHRLQGPECVQPFGWMSGCVLDALVDLGYERAAAAHLRLFMPEPDTLVYEDPNSRPADGRIAGIENTLPMAHIARRFPNHPAIAATLAYWRSHQDSEGCVIDGNMTSAEGSYTVAWPMAVIARLQRDHDLEDLAVRQLRLRRNRLIASDGLWLRSTPTGRTFRSWSRGVAWYSLGLARTLNLLADRPDLDDLRSEMRRVAAWAAPLQASNGLWNCFFDDPSTGAETSGSAGTAAAFAIAVRSGILPDIALQTASRTLAGLERSLTPDGLLGGASQSNRGGEALQRGGYRVLSQMGMGLMGQLIAALRPTSGRTA